MSFLNDWRSPCAPADVRGLERTDFAFEFLRRNPDYRADQARTMRIMAPGESAAETAGAAFEARWSLSFPGGPEPVLPRAGAALGA